MLAKFLNLMLNYQFGLSILVAPSLPRASSLLMEHDSEVRCAFIVHGEKVEKSGKNFRSVETRMGDVANHERIGKLLIMNANMGEELAAVVGTHHALGETSELACLVHIANNLAKEFELGYLSDEPAHYDRRALAALGMKASQIEGIRAELGDIVEEIKTMVEQCL